MSEQDETAAESDIAERQAQIDSVFDLVEKDLVRIEILLVKLEREADAVLARQAEFLKKYPQPVGEIEHGEYDDYEVEVPSKEGADAPVPFDE